MANLENNAVETQDVQTTVESSTETNVDVNSENENPTAPTVDELMAQLAQEKADKAKIKNALDKASSDAAEYKKALRAKMTAQEQASEAAKEEQAAKDARLEEAERKVSIYEATERYMTVNKYSSELARKAAEAEVAKDFVALSEINKQHEAELIKQTRAEIETEFYKNRPRVQSGTYSGMTKEDIMNIKDSNERAKAIHENINLFR